MKIWKNNFKKIKFPCYSTNIREMVKREIDRFDPSVPIEKAYTPPSTWYTNKHFFDEEKNIFKRNWIGLCSDKDLQEAGDYFTWDLFDQPILFLRNSENLILSLLFE